jgi:hypothetical protein
MSPDLQENAIPSRGGRRMTERAAQFVERVIHDVPVRQ